MTRLYTVAQFREISGYRSDAAVYKAIERGYVPAIRFGKSIRIPESAVVELKKLDRPNELLAV